MVCDANSRRTFGFEVKYILKKIFFREIINYYFIFRTLYEKSLDAKINPPPPPTEVEEEILGTPETEIETKKVEENEQSEVKDVDEAAGEEASDNTEENGN